MLPVSDCPPPVLEVSPEVIKHRGLPRSFDVMCATVGLLVLAPLFALIALAIKIASAGPVFYRQERIGKGFRAFLLVKFRTMVVGADRTGLLTSPSDTRVTQVGRVLRKYKLDELPQLINVFAGDMQLVGPRPEVPRYVDMFRPQFSLLLREAPGLTDPASMAYRNEENFFSTGQIEDQYVAEILPHKLNLSLEYQRRRTFTSDLWILLCTLTKLA